MYRKLLGVIAAIILVSGCVNRDEIYANPPQNLVQHVEKLLPAAEKFVSENELKALENGIALNPVQLTIASKVGLTSPEKVRVYYVNKLPFPKDPELAELAKKFGYSSPNMAAYTYGYGIWIKRGEKGNKELLSHELIHVRQSEQMGTHEQTKQYLMQLFIYGYSRAPLELEAYSEASKHI